jgi:hypothetical protein
MLADGAIKKEEDLEPEIGPFYFYLEAFHEIGTARSLGFGIGPIPFTAIAEYCKLFQIEDFEEFHYLMRRLDHVYLELNSSESDAKGGGKNGNTGKRNTNKNGRPRNSGG